MRREDNAPLVPDVGSGETGSPSRERDGEAIREDIEALQDGTPFVPLVVSSGRVVKKQVAMPNTD
ncbi:MAG: hypothetical protein SV760_01565 [Halobacteria archaeon]|nr:hypothetical protein [Halobacteria archaeon]